MGDLDLADRKENEGNRIDNDLATLPLLVPLPLLLLMLLVLEIGRVVNDKPLPEEEEEEEAEEDVFFLIG